MNFHVTYERVFIVFRIKTFESPVLPVRHYMFGPGEGAGEGSEVLDQVPEKLYMNLPRRIFVSFSGFLRYMFKAD